MVLSHPSSSWSFNTTTTPDVESSADAEPGNSAHSVRGHQFQVSTFAFEARKVLLPLHQLVEVCVASGR